MHTKHTHEQTNKQTSLISILHTKKNHAHTSHTRNIFLNTFTAKLIYVKKKPAGQSLRPSKLFEREANAISAPPSFFRSIVHAVFQVGGRRSLTVCVKWITPLTSPLITATALVTRLAILKVCKNFYVDKLCSEKSPTERGMCD